MKIGNWMRPILVSLALLGVQFTWTVELAQGNPFLLSLGLPKALTALVWLAGPLSGLLVQPLIGYWSDKSSSQWGRRRPFIVLGTILVNFAIILIAYTNEIGRSISYLFSLSEDVVFLPLMQEARLKITVAVGGFYLLDFSINAVQASCRTLIVDVSTLEEQNEASAWAGRMIGIGNVAGYYFGYLDLPKLFPSLGQTQLQVLCVITMLVLSLTVGITCWATTEEIVREESIVFDSGLYSPVFQIHDAWSNLPAPIELIFNTQFLAWIGWFPFLFYSSSWIGEHSGEEIDSRDGSFALLLFAITSLISGVLLPYIQSKLLRISLSRVWAYSLWFLGVIFASSMFIKSESYPMYAVALAGVSWAVTLWVPFTMLGEYISYYKSDRYILLDDMSGELTDSQLELSPAGSHLEPGMLLGLHNIYVCIPQFVSILMSMFIFLLFKTDPFGWAIRFGGLFSILGAFVAIRTRTLNGKAD